MRLNNMKAARLDVRTTDAAKATIESAANYMGITTSSFILECAVEKATQILQQAQTINLNDNESRKFTEILDNPPEPNLKLKKLFKKHKK